MTAADAITLLETARCPEDVFTDGDIQARFRSLARQTHTDIVGNDPRALEAFKRLVSLKAEAERKLKAGTFGKTPAFHAVLKTKTSEYILDEDLGPHSVYRSFGGVKAGTSEPCFIRIVANPADGDLAQNEALHLKALRELPATRELQTLQHVLPLTDTFEVVQNRVRSRVNIYPRLRGYVTLDQVHRTFPEGLPPRALAWMFRRLLAALFTVHRAGLVHGAVLPLAFWIRPDQPDDPTNPRPDDVHNGVLGEFSFCTAAGKRLKATVPGMAAYYPKDVFDRRPVDTGVDLHMAAQVLCTLAGGIQKLPDVYANLARACFLSPSRRLRDVEDLYDTFDKATRSLFGPPRFSRFQMPAGHPA